MLIHLKLADIQFNIFPLQAIACFCYNLLIQFNYPGYIAAAKPLKDK